MRISSKSVVEQRRELGNSCAQRVRTLLIMPPVLPVVWSAWGCYPVRQPAAPWPLAAVAAPSHLPEAHPAKASEPFHCFWALC